MGSGIALIVRVLNNVGRGVDEASTRAGEAHETRRQL